MAYSPADALTYVKKFIKDQPVDNASVGPQMLDLSAKFFWMYAPWTWTIGAMPIVTVAGGQTDYVVVTPADFFQLQQAWITDGNDENWLDIMPILPADPKFTTTPRRVSHVAGGTTYLRFYPKPASGGATRYCISFYKKEHTQITAANYETDSVQVFPDEWFHVFQEIVLYHAYKYADDTRAGEAAVKKAAGGPAAISYSGQLAVVIALLEDMKTRDDLLFNHPGTMQSKGQR